MKQVAYKRIDMTVYISGPITGDYLYREHFADAERKLKLMGFRVVNPVRISDKAKKGATYEDYMMADISAMIAKRCRMIVMLDGWEKSRGAVFERECAMMFGMDVITMRTDVVSMRELLIDNGKQ